MIRDQEPRSAFTLDRLLQQRDHLVGRRRGAVDFQGNQMPRESVDNRRDAQVQPKKSYARQIQVPDTIGFRRVHQVGRSQRRRNHSRSILLLLSA